MRSAEMSQHVTPDQESFLFVYKGTRVSQTPRVLVALDALCDAVKDDPPKVVIEVGTMYGGFTKVLRDHDLTKDAALYSFDILNRPGSIQGVTLIEGDVFGASCDRVIELLRSPGRVILFCDGGAKEREVSLFCRYTKPGDIVLCHDYAKTPETMNDKALVGDWPGYESQYCNVKDALEHHGFKPFLETEMQRAMWGCWRNEFVSTLPQGVRDAMAEVKAMRGDS